MKKAKIGSIIENRNRRVIITEVLYSDFFEGEGWMIEGRDQDGKYFYWKQYTDGGSYYEAKQFVISYRQVDYVIGLGLVDLRQETSVMAPTKEDAIETVENSVMDKHFGCHVDKCCSMLDLAKEVSEFYFDYDPYEMMDYWNDEETLVDNICTELYDSPETVADSLDNVIEYLKEDDDVKMLVRGERLRDLVLQWKAEGRA